MKLASGSSFSAQHLATTFVHTLIPIALAYHVAHFLMFLLIQGQTIIPLASDPFGFDWNIFNTTLYRVNFMIASPNFYWSIFFFFQPKFRDFSAIDRSLKCCSDLGEKSAKQIRCFRVCSLF